MSNKGRTGNLDVKHVKLRVSRKLLPKLMSNLPKGIGMTVYPNPQRIMGDDAIRNVTFKATMRNPDPRFRKNKDDIDNFLSRLGNIDPRIKLVQDKITLKDQPNLMEKPSLKIETMLDSPKLVNDPDMQKYLKNAQNVRKVKVTEGYLKDMEEMYKRMKKKMIETEFKRDDLERPKNDERDPETNEKIYYLRHGEI